MGVRSLEERLAHAKSCLHQLEINTDVCSGDPHNAEAQGLTGKADVFPLVRGRK